MSVCKVIKKTPGWNVGDSVEVEGAQLVELLKQQIVEVVEGPKAHTVRKGK